LLTHVSHPFLGKNVHVMELMQQEVQILHNVEIEQDYYRMGLAFPDLAKRAKPGQFVMVRVSERSIPLLRRPFSIHRPLIVEEEVQGFELLFKVVGEGTRALSEMKRGGMLDVLGPLGNGFSCPGEIHRAWVVAGGVGVASLYYRILHLTAHMSIHPTVFIGVCSASDVLCEKEFRSMGADVRVTTEDCSLGEMGLITALVERSLGSEKRPDMIYACGPQAMLRAVGQIAVSHAVPCQVSLESAMACGFGVCLGCAVEKAHEPGTYYHVCSDGPVFDAGDVKI